MCRFFALIVLSLVALSNTALCKTPLPPLEQPMSYGGGQEWVLWTEDECGLYIREYGNSENPTWIVLHGGWGGEHSYLLDAFQGFESDYHLVFYDQRGSLRSWQCELEEISVEVHIQDLEQIRRSLDLDRVNLAAHSMGGFLAGAYQRSYPDRVGKLLLIAPGLPKLPLDSDERAVYEPWIEGYHADDYAPMGQFDIASKLMQERSAVREELARSDLDRDSLSARQRNLRWRLEFAAANIYHVDRWPLFRGGDVFHNNRAGQMAAMSMEEQAPWDFVTQWKKHDHPVTVVIGDHDFVDWRAALLRHWFEDDEHVQLVVLERAGHVPWIDQPAAFRSSITQALSPPNRDR